MSCEQNWATGCFDLWLGVKLDWYIVLDVCMYISPSILYINDLLDAVDLYLQSLYPAQSVWYYSLHSFFSFGYWSVQLIYIRNVILFHNILHFVPKWTICLHKKAYMTVLWSPFLQGFFFVFFLLYNEHCPQIDVNRENQYIKQYW